MPNKPSKSTTNPTKLCATATFHDLVGGGFEACGGPSPSLVVIVGIGEGGSASVDRQPAGDRPTLSLHGDLSASDGLGSAGTSADIPLHGSPSIGASAGVLGFGPDAAITRSDKKFATQFGVEGPLSKPEKTQSSGSTSHHSVSADASLDLHVPIPWQYVQPDSLITPATSRQLLFGF
jgi:hypothetical protein